MNALDTTTTPVRRTSRAAAMPADERRAAIIEATLPLLVEHGDRVTTRQIADAAGIAEGTIFRVFADKDELIESVVDSALDPAPLEDALGAIDAEAPFEDVLAAAIVVLQRRVIDVFRLSSGLAGRLHLRASRPTADSPALIALFSPRQAALRVEPRVAARYLRSVTLSLTHPLLIEHPADPAEIVRLFLHGAAAGEAC